MGPRGDLSLPIPGLLDTGSFSTILPRGTAEDVGIRPQAGSPFSIAIGGSTVQAREAGEVLLRIEGRERTGIGEERVLEIRSRPLLVDSPLFLDLALLGSRGFLDRVDEFCVRAREEVFEIAQG
ncbi:MAG: hypothetical protein L0323_03705 [Planctomycetes bacterium]|nr:hypothetical protein [Planctomycetota bacterium]